MEGNGPTCSGSIAEDNTCEEVINAYLNCVTSNELSSQKSFHEDNESRHKLTENNDNLCEDSGVPESENIKDGEGSILSMKNEISEDGRYYMNNQESGVPECDAHSTSTVNSTVVVVHVPESTTPRLENENVYQITVSTDESKNQNEENRNSVCQGHCSTNTRESQVLVGENVSHDLDQDSSQCCSSVDIEPSFNNVSVVSSSHSSLSHAQSPSLSPTSSSLLEVVGECTNTTNLTTLGEIEPTDNHESIISCNAIAPIDLFCDGIRTTRSLSIQPIQMETSRRKSLKCTCQHRTLCSPPCYNCTTTDLPPKYKEVDKSTWGKVKNRFLTSLDNITKTIYPHHSASHSWEIEGVNNAAFTISDGRLVGDVPAPSSERLTPPQMALSNDNQSQVNETSGQRQYSTYQQERLQVHGTNAVENNTDYVSSENARTAGEIYWETRNGSTENTRSAENYLESRIGTDPLQNRHSDPPPYSVSEGVPPPYSPPTPASLISGYRQQNMTEVTQSPTTFEIRHVELTRGCQCNVFYSLLLAIVTTVVIFGTEPDVSLLASSVTFFTFVVYMPLIWALECILQWRMHARRQEEGSRLTTFSPTNYSPTSLP